MLIIFLMLILQHQMVSKFLNNKTIFLLVLGTLSKLLKINKKHFFRYYGKYLSKMTKFGLACFFWVTGHEFRGCKKFKNTPKKVANIRDKYSNIYRTPKFITRFPKNLSNLFCFRICERIREYCGITLI